jgi:hypothetical protein
MRQGKHGGENMINTELSLSKFSIELPQNLVVELEAYDKEERKMPSRHSHYAGI